ncbi:MAG: hypothetical protein KZQ64_01525 [gamma proteobacterium symbiont of Bathyaustriella thionipta]|nr:hypothetical protein [gamma proteobacterium symbiont of Bathyaustriella thionipta]MCU7949190.1 hypothetical protein [gamma proteobacterium symbiont of Bathyaustriella thionipta]MCU7952076.1 hypothetical protein [gamma proteobacterium symbiont of Bathyaustriella thionipta]MCU7955768.1 hypothetical protein [gamma proteobacterium symbiont of Bathyaustriella thionipta]MCU7965670.1 hypothetical protein [gamma proteobacterium symbiont of Bathyaustriella thionipta]
MMKNLLLLLLLVFINLNPLRGVSADESDPCMGEYPDYPVSPVLIDYYNEFKDSASTVDIEQQHPDIKLNPIKNALANYYSEFLE